MNPHFQPYSDSHSPSPDNNNYTTISGNNGINVNGNSMVQHHHHHHHPHQNGHSVQQIPIEGRVPGSVNEFPVAVGPGSGGPSNFHQLNNNNSSIKHCAGCGGKIVERFFLHALDRYWHNSCLKCYCCGAMLADIGSSCYTRSGMILCKSDYTRMFGTAPCSACGQTIAANEFVMRTTSPVGSSQQHQQQQQQDQQQSLSSSILENHPKPFPGQVEHHVFHLKCFACSKCSSQLRPGDRYYMLAGSLVCEQDWHKLLKNTTTNPPIRKGKVGRPRRSRD